MMYEIASDLVCLFFLRTCQRGLKEKYAENGKYDEELDENDYPQCLSHCHSLEAFIIEHEYFTKESHPPMLQVKERHCLSSHHGWLQPHP